MQAAGSGSSSNVWAAALRTPFQSWSLTVLSLCFLAIGALSRWLRRPPHQGLRAGIQNFGGSVLDDFDLDVADRVAALLALDEGFGAALVGPGHRNSVIVGERLAVFG